MNKKFTSLLFVFLLPMMLIFSGCGEKEEEAKETLYPASDEYVLYYVNNDSTSLVPKLTTFDKSESVRTQMNKMINKLTGDASNLEYKSCLPQNVSYLNVQYDDVTVTISLSSTFYDAPASAALLCEASFVKSLTQIEGVDNVAFSVGSQPLMNGENVVGALTADSFADSDARNDVNQVQYVTIYFTNVTGDRLEPLRIPINVSGHNSAEELVLERLIAGTSERGYYSTIPKDTKLLSVSTKDSVCYVDFSEEFMTMPENVLDQTVIYSVVNSLCELSTVSKVSFTIEGEQQELYNGNVVFNQLFERNLDLVDVD
ncbi:MAG: GerMN domain-containing protein [Lachnospiraceae bacterium]|nr:GerMN domain-containing protein [Lachnospiraceae bacterium]